MKIAIPDYFSIYSDLKQFGPRQGPVASAYCGALKPWSGMIRFSWVIRHFRA